MEIRWFRKANLSVILSITRCSQIFPYHCISSGESLDVHLVVIKVLATLSKTTINCFLIGGTSQSSQECSKRTAGLFGGLRPVICSICTKMFSQNSLTGRQNHPMWPQTLPGCGIALGHNFIRLGINIKTSGTESLWLPNVSLWQDRTGTTFLLNFF